MINLKTMKKNILFIACLFILGCANGQSSGEYEIASLPKPKPGEEVATFGGGCFWSLTEAMSELKGVNTVVAGFAGGTTKNPTYEEVCTRTTGHAECVQVYYNPKIISYETLVTAFFFAHNPTELNRQGPDVGTDYRSVAFYRTPAEKATIMQVIKKIDASKHYSDKIVTQVLPYAAFYAAEKYHQGYYRLHGDNPYIAGVSEPKVLKFRKAMKAELKAEFAN